MPLQATLIWYAHTERPAHPLIALVAMDCGPDGDPDDFRFSLRADLFQYRGGRGSGAWFSLLTGERIAANQAFRWTPYEDVLTGLEIATDLQESAP
jgi:hypothetical protein